ncbi:MAG: chemotaxis protein CheX [Candidatus Solibacter sp.]
MTDQRIHAALSAAVADVLESMFFLETVVREEEANAAADSIDVEIGFEGNPPGRFEMRLAAGAANAIAADFLGEDGESLSEQQRMDVTLELANMICGSVLSRLESSALFRLGSPRISARLLAGGEITRHTVETGNGCLTVAIQMEGRVCPAVAEYGS